MAVTQISLAGNLVNLVAMPAKPGLKSVEFDTFDGVGIVSNPFTGKTQAQQWHGGDMWSGKATLPPLAQADADNWIGFLEELRGMANAFQMGDPLKTAPRGSGSGAPMIDNTQNGGNPAGSILLGTKGWTPSAVGVLLPGDYIQTGYRLYRVLDRVDADSSGNALISIWPSLREQPANNGTSAGWINAAGTATQTQSRSLGNTYYGVLWSDFGIPPNVTLPSDAVIQGIYPVIICSGTHDRSNQYVEYGPSCTLGVTGGSSFATVPVNTTFASAEFYDVNIGTSLSVLAAQKIRMILNQSLFYDGMIDALTATGVGFAVYYTSATPVISTQMAPPFTVPAGQGLAWALPFGLTDTGVQTGGGLLGPGSGTGLGTPALDNGGLVLYDAKGIFRLATNKRDWKADIQRVTAVSFPFQEYR